MKTAKGFIIGVGIVSIGVAAIGLWYNLTTLFTDFSDLVQQQHLPYFYPAFYIMSSICVACYTILVVCGVQFLRLRTKLLRLFVSVIIFEVVYFFAIAALWLAPRIGTSVRGATGVANGGMMFQAFILFPLWAPFLAGWAARRVSRIEELSNKKGYGVPSAVDGL